MVIIFFGDLHLVIWQLLQVVQICEDMICALYGVWKSKNFTFWGFTWILDTQLGPGWENMDFKKSLLAYVCVHRICSKPRTVIPLVSEHRYMIIWKLSNTHMIPVSYGGVENILRAIEIALSSWENPIYLKSVLCIYWVSRYHFKKIIVSSCLRRQNFFYASYDLLVCFCE